MAGDDNDIEEEVRAAVHVIIARLMLAPQKAFILAIAAPEIALLSQAEATMMINILNLTHL